MDWFISSSWRCIYSLNILHYVGNSQSYIYGIWSHESNDDNNANDNNDNIDNHITDENYDKLNNDYDSDVLDVCVCEHRLSTYDFTAVALDIQNNCRPEVYFIGNGQPNQQQVITLQY